MTRALFGLVPEVLKPTSKNYVLSHSFFCCIIKEKNRKGGKTMKKFLFLCGIVGGVISQFFGGWTTATATLFIFMGLDYLTGILNALIFNNSDKTINGGLSSKIGFKGLVKKCMIIIFLLMAYRLDLTINVHYIRDSVCIAFICNEALSIIENATLMGFPTPDILKNALEVLKKKEVQK